MACWVTSLWIGPFDNIENTIDNNEIGIEKIFIIGILESAIFLIISTSFLIESGVKDFVSEKPNAMDIGIALPFYEEFVFFEFFFLGFLLFTFTFFFTFTFAFFLFFSPIFLLRVRGFYRFVITFPFGGSMTQNLINNKWIFDNFGELVTFFFFAFFANFLFYFDPVFTFDFTDEIILFTGGINKIRNCIIVIIFSPSSLVST